MTTLEIILICSNIVFLVLLGTSVLYNIRHGILLINIIEAIEDTLDILDEKYASMSKILETPLFFDSPQIRSVIDDIRICRDSLLRSANILTIVRQEEDEEKTDN